MSVDAKNVVSLTGRLTADPEFANDGKIAKLRLAVDWAGREKDSDNNAGFFDVTMFKGDDQNSKFAFSQFEKQNMQKGTAVMVLGRLMHERWSTDEGKRSKVVIVAESIAFAGSKGDSDTKSDKASEEQTELPTRF